MLNELKKLDSEITPEVTPKFDYKECYGCGSSIHVVGQKFCSDYCKDTYQKKLEKKFS